MGVEDEVRGEWERQWIGTKALLKVEYSFQSEQSSKSFSSCCLLFADQTIDPLNSITWRETLATRLSFAWRFDGAFLAQ
jgi:hypothetical protein